MGFHRFTNGVLTCGKRRPHDGKNLPNDLNFSMQFPIQLANEGIGLVNWLHVTPILTPKKRMGSGKEKTNSLKYFTETGAAGEN